MTTTAVAGLAVWFPRWNSCQIRLAVPVTLEEDVLRRFLSEFSVDQCTQPHQYSLGQLVSIQLSEDAAPEHAQEVAARFFGELGALAGKPADEPLEQLPVRWFDFNGRQTDAPADQPVAA